MQAGNFRPVLYNLRQHADGMHVVMWFGVCAGCDVPEAYQGGCGGPTPPSAGGVMCDVMCEGTSRQLCWLHVIHSNCHNWHGDAGLCRILQEGQCRMQGGRNL